MRSLDFDSLTGRLKVLLRGRGPLTAKTICKELEISQATFSRLLEAKAKETNDLLILGRARATTYALRKKIPSVPDTLPLYQVSEEGKVRHVADLNPVEPKGFWIEHKIPGRAAELFPDLPYFLDDLRPAGFLGRIIPMYHKELGLPSDILQWSVGDCLLYWNRLGWDLVGDFIVGEEALKHYLNRRQNAEEPLKKTLRKKAYPELSLEIMLRGPEGSSAGGEQPKFLVNNLENSLPVMVKFSPGIGWAVGQRVADLLVCEHIAHEVLARWGVPAAKSELFFSENKAFLEIERFDRTSKGRRGLVSIRMLGAEFVGVVEGWTEIAKGLLSQKRIDRQTFERIRKVEIFGELIGNSDMHGGNLSFYFEPFELAGLAPIYDMLPMSYAPRQNQLIDRAFQPSLPTPANKDPWLEALEHALEFWKKVSASTEISKSFRAIAAVNRAALVRQKELAQELL